MNNQDYKTFAYMKQVTRGWSVVTSDGFVCTNTMWQKDRKKALSNQLAFASKEVYPKMGDWETISFDQFEKATGFRPDYSSYNGAHVPLTSSKKSAVAQAFVNVADDDEKKEQKDRITFIHKDSIKLRPKTLKITDLKWKTLVRSVDRGDNIMMTGPAGSGKTQSARSVANAMERPFSYFNMGAMQDARSSLIGNLHFDKDKGTYLEESEFLKAIQTENCVILLDEISRSTHDAWNILMTVLDKGQRYVRVDESNTGESKIINVHETVTFIATANIGMEYTATRAMDKATLDRFKIIEMDVLNKKDEFSLLKLLFPDLNPKILEAVASIAAATREEVKQQSDNITDIISTRMSVELCSMIFDGFSLVEASEVCIYPFYSADGGGSSERVFVTSLVQKFIPQDVNWDNLFNTSEPKEEEPEVETEKEEDSCSAEEAFDFFTANDFN